jgi:hypothetical protein
MALSLGKKLQTQADWVTSQTGWSNIYDSGNLNSHSGNLNTDSGKSKKVFSLKPESVFKLNQNGCSDWIRMGVQVEPEYATYRSDYG